LVVLVLVGALWASVSGAGAQSDPATAQEEWAAALEEQGRFGEAVWYRDRAARARASLWWPFLGQPRDEPWIEANRQKIQADLDKEPLDDAARQRLRYSTELWLQEAINVDRGGFLMGFGLRALEAEKRGDFALAAWLRRAEAHFCQTVGGPYHQSQQQVWARTNPGEARLHQQQAAFFASAAQDNLQLAEGEELLAALPELRDLAPPLEKTDDYGQAARLFAERIADQGGWKTKATPEQVAEKLRPLTRHEEPKIRWVAVRLLAALNDTTGLRQALEAEHPEVRQIAAAHLRAEADLPGLAKMLAGADEALKAAAAAVFPTQTAQLPFSVRLIENLLQAVAGEDEALRQFATERLQQISQQNLTTAAEWQAWWAANHTVEPGLVRTVEGHEGTAIDAEIAFGSWWQTNGAEPHSTAITHEPNPLQDLPKPATVRWEGYLYAPASSSYVFFIRHRGNRPAEGPHGYFVPEPAARLWIGDQPVIGPDSESLADPQLRVRWALSQSVPLRQGWYPLKLEFRLEESVRVPEVRLSWRAAHFLPQLIGAQYLFHQVSPPEG